MQIITQEKTDMVMIQEPHLYQNSIKGITSGYQMYTHGNGKSRAAILITNNTIDALLLTQYSKTQSYYKYIKETKNSTQQSYTLIIKRK